MPSSDHSPSLIRPTPGQLRYQRSHQFGLFCHFGINTFHGREWSDGTLPAHSFLPTHLDAQNWANTARDAGAAHLILTAKHHDGFCLWPTATTDYSVASSPWRDGHGDVVADTAAACQRAGIGFGVYLSPWDRHEPAWATDHTAYDQLYLRQLTELCTNYGELYEMWFDGAGSEQHPYDWDSIMGVVDRYQPQAMVFNMGRPTIRWIGNEDGLADNTCWYVVDATHRSMFDQNQNALADGARYLPPECDVAIRRHWFWHADDLSTLKSRQHLEAIWYRSVGLGANLLLNVPPDTRGRFDDHDRQRLLDFGRTIRERFATPCQFDLHHEGTTVVATFPELVTFDHLVVKEAIELGQRVRQHRITLLDGTLLAAGHTIGSQRVHAFPAVRARELRIELDDPAAQLAGVSTHSTGIESIPSLEDQPAFARDKMD